PRRQPRERDQRRRDGGHPEIDTTLSLIDVGAYHAHPFVVGPAGRRSRQLYSVGPASRRSGISWLWRDWRPAGLPSHGLRSDSGMWITVIAVTSHWDFAPSRKPFQVMNSLSPSSLSAEP